MKKLSVFIASFDGILTRHSGVGSATIAYIRTIPEIRKALLLNRSIDLTFYALTNKYDASAWSRNLEIEKEVRDICHSTGGKLLTCLNNSSGDTHFGNIQNWTCVSASAATQAVQVLENNEFDYCIFMAHDTPYAMAPIYLVKQNFTKTKIIGTFTPHGTSLIHEKGEYNLDRIKWESEAFQEFNKNSNLFVCHISNFMKNHLHIDYGVNQESLLPMLNGIDFKELIKYKKQNIVKIFNKYNIPTNKPLIVTYGRGASYKGYDIFIEAVKKLKLPFHYVLQAVPYNPIDDIELKLKDATNGMNNITTIFEWSFDLPRMLLQWDKTFLTCLLSRREPGALIPAEIRYNAKSLCLVSDQDGLPCQVTDGVDGFITEIDSYEKVADKIKHIYQLPKDKQELIKRTGLNLIKENYNMRNNFSASFNNLVNKLI